MSLGERGFLGSWLFCYANKDAIGYAGNLIGWE